MKLPLDRSGWRERELVRTIFGRLFLVLSLGFFAFEAARFCWLESAVSFGDEIVGHERRGGEPLGIEKAYVGIGFGLSEKVADVERFRDGFALDGNGVALDVGFCGGILAIGSGEFEEL